MAGHWESKPNADEIAAELHDRIGVETDKHFIERRYITGIANAAVAIAGKADEWCAIAYANGYKAALDDCEKAEVGKLIEQIAALEGRLSFEKAKCAVAERRFDELAAHHQHVLGDEHHADGGS